MLEGKPLFQGQDLGLNVVGVWGGEGGSWLHAEGISQWRVTSVPPSGSVRETRNSLLSQRTFSLGFSTYGFQSSRLCVTSAKVTHKSDCPEGLAGLV